MTIIKFPGNPGDIQIVDEGETSLGDYLRDLAAQIDRGILKPDRIVVLMTHPESEHDVAWVTAHSFNADRGDVAAIVHKIRDDILDTWFHLHRKP